MFLATAEPSYAGSQSKDITPLVLSKFLLPELKQQAGGSKLGLTRKMKIAMKESTERQEQELWVLTGWDMTRARVSESSPAEEAESTVEGKLHKSIQQNGRKLEQMWFGA